MSYFVVILFIFLYNDNRYAAFHIHRVKSIIYNDSVPVMLQPYYMYSYCMGAYIMDGSSLVNQAERILRQRLISVNVNTKGLAVAG